MKIILVSLLLLAMPAISTAAVRPSAPRISTPRVSTPRVSTPKVSTPRASTPKTTTPRPTYVSTPHNNFYSTTLPVWILLWSSTQNRNNQFTAHDHFPYIIVVDKTLKEYQVLRYTGPDNKHEKVSEQEQAGLTWLKGEIKF